jgi:hypothetical protein
VEHAYPWRAYGIRITILQQKAHSPTKHEEAKHSVERVVAKPGRGQVRRGLCGLQWTPSRIRPVNLSGED